MTLRYRTLKYFYVLLKEEVMKEDFNKSSYVKRVFKKYNVFTSEDLYIYRFK